MPVLGLGVLTWFEAHSSPVLSCGPFLEEFPFPVGNTGSPTVHQDLADARAGIYFCDLFVVTITVMEDLVLIFDPA